LQQINGISVTALTPPRPGLRPLPLLPEKLSTSVQTAFYGVITDSTNPKLLKAFVADYRMNGQDVQLFEQVTEENIPSTAAHSVQIGSWKGQVFEDEAGNHAVQWEQSGMSCQLTSKLPITLLLQLASVFRPIKNWEVILS